MAQTTINFSMDSELKKNMEEVCGKVGLSLAAAFTMFARKVAEEHAFRRRLLTIRFTARKTWRNRPEESRMSRRDATCPNTS